MRELRQRQPRMLDKGYLAFLHTKRCAFCGKHPPVEAAHIRMACLEVGKRETGKSEKPDDKWAVPLCSWCHRERPESQHNIGEKKFWELAEVNPFELAQKLYAEYGGDGGKPRARKTKTKPRPPKNRRRSITKRKKPWPKRSLSKRN